MVIILQLVARLIKEKTRLCVIASRDIRVNDARNVTRFTMVFRLNIVAHVKNAFVMATRIKMICHVMRKQANVRVVCMERWDFFAINASLVCLATQKIMSVNVSDF